MTDKTFLVAGTTFLKGKTVARFANGTAKARVKVLEKNGDVDIKLFDLPKSMTKAAAVTFLREKHADAFVDADWVALDFAVAGNAPAKTVKTKAAKPAKTVKKTKTVKAARPVAAEKSPEDKAAIKASNLEKIKAAAKAMKKRTQRFLETEENVQEYQVEADADLVDLTAEFAPAERGARLAEEI